MVELTVSIPLGVGKVVKRHQNEYDPFTALQVKLLIKKFIKNPYLSKKECKALAFRLQTSAIKVRKWFVNQRYKIRNQGGDVKGNQ